MMHRSAIVPLCCAVLLCGCPDITAAGAACDETRQCPAGFVCDPTGHCDTGCPAGMETCSGSCVAPGTCAADFTVPGAPTHVAATAGSGEATVTWTAPAQSGGSAITGYTVTSKPGAIKVTTTGATTATVTGLTNGTGYSFTVHATSSAGNGPESAPSNIVTPLGVPGAPTDVMAQPASQAATITWTAPASNGASAITSYTVTASPGGATMSSSGETTLYFMGLTNGTAYTFTVFATNAIGVGPDSLPSSPVTPATVPAAPTNVSAMPGNTQATISWTQPADDGGSPILGYVVTADPGGATADATGTTTATITGLTNGTTYTFTVLAVNAIGDSLPSAPSAPVTPANVPGAPTGVRASATSGQAAVTWTAPDDGGSPITRYTVTSSPGGITAFTTGATSVTVTGLTNWTIYTFTVVATNTSGNGPPSSASNPVIPEMVPGAPTGVTASPGDMQATVTWSPPASDGGNAIVGYTVTASPGGAMATTTGANTATVTGLTNGIAYTFTVVAANGAGNGPPSSPSAPVTPANMPGVPTGVLATPGNAEATITWTAPASDGGSAITGYTVTASPGGATQSTTNATSLVFTGLTNGQSYTFTVFATNAIGNGLPSAPSAAISPLTVPGAPKITTIVAGNTQAIVSWTAPASDGGSPITGYTVTASPGSQKATTTGATTATITGLVNGLNYSFSVTATNAAGTGPASALGDCVPFGPPGLPTEVLAVGGVNEATISWTAPASDGGSAITGYTVTEMPDGTTLTVTSGTSATMTGLATGATYTFTVYATNAAGNGPASDPTPAVTTANLPGAPTDVLATAAVQQATVSWTAAQDNGSPITSYTVTTSPGGTIQTTTSTSLAVTGLANGGTYTFTVFATNAVGNGPTATASVTLPSLPSAPAITNAAAANAQATITWTAPASDGNSSILSYTVTSSPGGFASTVSGLTATVTGLTNGTAYTFQVYATNAVGNGPASAASAPVTPLTIPGPPTNVVATAGVGQATISWTAPASNGGSAITSYTVTSSTGGFTSTTSATSTTITGLTAGSSYSFLVYATTAVGNSGSASSNTITLPTPPNAPGAPSATVGGGKVTVTWMAPSDGGSPITGYTLTVVQTGATLTTSATTATVSGLSPGSYTFTVVATNVAGNSAASPPSPAVTLVEPPSDLTYSANPAVYTIGQAITNNVPSSGGGPVASYTLSSLLPSGLDFNGTTGVISGTPGVGGALNTTNFTVTATNSGGSTSVTLTMTVNCSNGSEACDNNCPDYQSDDNNCGSCGHSCDGQTCCSGSCCGDTCCNGSCSDLSSDPYNCGYCGLDCYVGITDHACCSGVCCL